MLWSNPVHHLHRLLEIFDNQNGTSSMKACRSDFSSFQRGELSLYFLLCFPSECFRVGNQNGERHFIMLSLGDEVCRYKGNRRALIGDDHNLAWPSHHIYIHITIDQSFSRSHILLSWSNHLIHLRDRFRPIGESGDGLNPSYPIDSITPR